MSAEREAEALLRATPAFAGLDDAGLAAIAAASTWEDVAAGSTVFRVGDPATSVALIRSGRVQVLDEDGSVLTERGAHAVLGELGVLAGTPRAATVRAVRDTELLVVPAAAFAAALASRPGAALEIARSLAGRLQRSRDVEVPSPALGVVALVAAAADPVWPALVDVVVDELGRLRRVTLLRHSADDADRTAARAEAAGDVVVLAVADPSADPAWLDHCLRSADRVVLVTRGEASVVDGHPGAAGCHVAAIGQLGGRRVGELLDRYASRSLHRLADPPTSSEVARLVRRVTGGSLGLVLSGGGARGLAHVGALLALEAAGLRPDRLGGTSMGALVAALAARGWSAERIRAELERELVQHHPFTDYTVPRRSLLKGAKAWAMLGRLLGTGTVEELPLPFFSVSADLLTGERVVHRRGRLREVVGASMAVPGLAPPVAHHGRLLVDGGVIDNLPVEVMAEDGEGMVVAVDVMRHADHPRRSLGRAGASAGAPPSIVETLVRASLLGSWERAERNRERADVLVVPEVSSLGLLAFDRMQEAVDAGRAATAAAIAEAGLGAR